MKNLIIDLDQISFDVRERLDSGIAHIAAVNASINHASGLTSAITAYAYTNLVLLNLEPDDELEIQRFTALRKEARGIVSQFWQIFKLFPIQRANGAQALVQVVEQPAPSPVVNPQHIKRVERPHKEGRKPRVLLADEQKQEILAYIRNLGDHLSETDYQDLMRAYDISHTTIDNIRYIWSRKNGR